MTHKQGSGGWSVLCNYYSYVALADNVRSLLVVVGAKCHKLTLFGATNNRIETKGSKS